MQTRHLLCILRSVLCKLEPAINQNDFLSNRNANVKSSEKLKFGDLLLNRRNEWNRARATATIGSGFDRTGPSSHFIELDPHGSTLVVSIGLFWFYYLPFSYNWPCFLQFIFNRKFGQYQSAHSFWAKFWSPESNFLSLTLCSFVSNAYNYKNKFNGDYYNLSMDLIKYRI